MNPDPVVFEELVRDYARMMASAIRRVCGQRHQSLVPDVQQEVYLALWKRLGSGKKIDYPTSYLYKMALTTALAAIKKHGSAVSLDDDVSTGEVPTPAEVIDLLPVERGHLIDQLLATLEADAGRALRGYLAGFNHREVAKLYGWTESKARHLIYRSIERLRDRLAQEDE